MSSQAQDERAAAPAGRPLLAVVGGPRGVLETVLPGLVFVVAVTATGAVPASALAALGCCALAVLARLLVRQPVGPAVSGALGVGVCALAAWRSGRATAYYTPALVLDAVLALVLAASTLPLARRPGGPGRPSRPLVGVLVSAARGQGGDWWHGPDHQRLARQLTWMWSALFAARVAVQVPLSLAGALTALGVVHLVMGVPLYAAGVWVTWLAQRPAGPAATPAPARSRRR